jgi:hypothetical protein
MNGSPQGKIGDHHSFAARDVQDAVILGDPLSWSFPTEHHLQDCRWRMATFFLIQNQDRGKR